jgi:hypothetical protein
VPFEELLLHLDQAPALIDYVDYIKLLQTEFREFREMRQDFPGLSGTYFAICD